MTTTTEVFYTGDGSTTLYTFPFPYLEDTDIYVGILNETTDVYDVKAQDDPTYGWAFANANTIEFNAAVPAPSGTKPNIRIYRRTDTSSLPAVFAAGAPIRAADLNDNFNQSLYINQEASDVAAYTEDLADELLADNAATRAIAENAETTANAANAKSDAAVVTADEAKALAEQADAVNVSIIPVYETPGDNTTPVDYIYSEEPFDIRNGLKLPFKDVATYQENGALRYNDDLNRLEVYDDGVAPAGPTAWINAAAGASISSAPPSVAVPGDIWYDQDDGRSYVYYQDTDSSQWVEMNPSWNGSVVDDSVSTAKIVDGAVTTAKIADDAVTEAKLSDDVVEKLDTFVSVKSFGAVGDGVADDTAAFTAALAASDSVYIPQGSYKLSSTIALTSGDTLIGSSKESCELIGSTADPVITCIKTADVVRKVTVSNLSVSTTGAPTQLIHLKGARECTFSGVQINANGATNGIFIEGAATFGSYYNYFIGSEVYGASGVGMLLDGDTDNSGSRRANGNTFTNCRFDANATGAQVIGCDAVSFHGCNAEGNAVVGFKAGTSGRLTPVRTTWSGGYIENTSGTDVDTVDAVSTSKNSGVVFVNTRFTSVVAGSTYSYLGGQTQETVTDTASTVVTGYRRHSDTENRLQFSPAAIELGSGTATPDVSIKRLSANTIGPDAANDFQIGRGETAPNGGLLRLGSYWLWVDDSLGANNPSLRIKSGGRPTAITDGTVIGP